MRAETSGQTSPRSGRPRRRTTQSWASDSPLDPSAHARDFHAGFVSQTAIDFAMAPHMCSRIFLSRQVEWGRCENWMCSYHAVGSRGPPRRRRSAVAHSGIRLCARRLSETAHPAPRIEPGCTNNVCVGATGKARREGALGEPNDWVWAAAARGGLSPTPDTAHPRIRAPTPRVRRLSPVTVTPGGPRPRPRPPAPRAAVCVYADRHDIIHERIQSWRKARQSRARTSPHRSGHG